MNKSNIEPEVAAQARDIGDSISPTRPRSPISPPRVPGKQTFLER